MIFRGTFEYALDAKHRLTVPPKYRAALASGVVLALMPETQKGSDTRALSIWPADSYDDYVETALAGMNPLSPKAQDLHQMLYANSWELELDSANRLMVPQRAMDFAGLTKEVVITGAGRYLQVWDRAVQAKYNEAVLARYPEIVASFDHTD